MALLALLVATVATVAGAVRVEPLHRLPDALDDGSRGCGDAVTAILENLSNAELRHNPNLSRLWDRATAEWCRRRSREPSREPPRPSEPGPGHRSAGPHHGGAQRGVPRGRAGSSRREYRHGFHFKALHFLLSEALRRLREPRRCHRTFRGFGDVWLDAWPGRVVRLGQFLVTSRSREVARAQGNVTLFQVNTCHGAIIQNFSYHPGERQLLVPPFETFRVTKVTRDGKTTRIHLNSSGTFSKYNCERLRGGSLPSHPPHLGGLLLATVAMAVASGTL